MMSKRFVLICALMIGMCLGFWYMMILKLSKATAPGLIKPQVIQVTKRAPPVTVTPRELSPEDQQLVNDVESLAKKSLSHGQLPAATTLFTLAASIRLHQQQALAQWNGAFAQAMKDLDDEDNASNEF